MEDQLSYIAVEKRRSSANAVMKTVGLMTAVTVKAA